MYKLFLGCSLLLFVSFNGGSHSTKNKDNVSAITRVHKIPGYTGLKGTWVRHNAKGFTLIEIKDTSNVLYYEFIDNQAGIGKAGRAGYWYYKSKATVGYWDSLHIWIGTDKFRFDYKIKGDKLIEFDKMGDQGTFIKVEADQE